MTYKDLTHIRARKDERDKLNAMSRKLSVLEDKAVRVPEVLRRALNIPRLPKVLEDDAIAKRRIKNSK